MVEVGRGEFSFSAAHAGLHDGEFEPLHGHNFEVKVRLSGQLDGAGMLVDFSDIKRAVRQAIAPLHLRVLMPGQAPGIRIVPDDGTVSISVGAKNYVLPARDVVVLPLVNTSTEAIAGYLLGRVLECCCGERLVAVELQLFETPTKSAIVRADLHSAPSGTSS